MHAPKLLRCLCAIVVGVSALLVPSVAQPASATAPACDAVAQHEDASHSGMSCSALPSIPSRQWSVTLNGQSSYPLIASGKIFVTTPSTTNSYGGWLYALDQRTGSTAWGPVPLTGTYDWSSLAYDNGTVFVNNFDGTITAFDAATGSQRWAQNTSYFSGELVAYQGILYLHGSNNVFALSETTGATVWTSGGLDGDGSSVSVDGSGVYVAAGCSWYRLSLTTGAILWSGNNGCGGGGGGTTYVADGRVFATPSFGSAFVLDQATGAKVGSYGGIPAFLGGNVYLAAGYGISAETVSTLTPIFTAGLIASVTTSPVIAGNTVYVGAGTDVIGVDATTGQTTWTASVPASTGGGGQYGSPISDIAIGDGLLVVPAGDTLTAFGQNFAGTLNPTPPARVLDTRNGNGASGPVAAGGTVSLTVAGRGGVPASGVGAVALTVVVTQPKAAGSITAYADGSSPPGTSNLNFAAGQTIANLVIVRVGADGKVDFRNASAGTVQLVADVSGWFASGAPTPGGFAPLSAARILDTRRAIGASGPVAAGGTLSLTVAGRGGVPASGVGAVALTVAATQPGAAGSITAYPDGSARPGTSNLNFAAGQTIANLVIVPVGADGKVDFHNASSGTVQLVADVSGWFASGAPAPGGFAPLSAVRLLDTRRGYGASGPVVAGGSVSMAVAGHGGVPASGVGAVALTVVVTQPNAPGSITAYPDSSSQPGTSNLNFAAGQTVANVVIVPVGVDGRVDFYNASGGTVQLVADVAGWFAN